MTEHQRRVLDAWEAYIHSPAGDVRDRLGELLRLVGWPGKWSNVYEVFDYCYALKETVAAGVDVGVPVLDRG